MKSIRWMARAILICAAVAGVYASDFTGVYARIDKVVLEPNTDSPERIQVWGVFSLADPADRQNFLAPAKGYLYFKLDRDPKVARVEWSDLKQVAGTRDVVAFGARTERPPRLRKADEKPDAPDPYFLNVGVQKVTGRTDYPPIRKLLDYKD